jgi:hypothetical protein
MRDLLSCSLLRDLKPTASSVAWSLSGRKVESEKPFVGVFFATVRVDRGCLSRRARETFSLATFSETCNLEIEVACWFFELNG